MTKFTINDWYTVQTRKDVMYLRRSIVKNPINMSILIEIFSAVFAFALNNAVFSKKPTPGWYWGVVAVVLFAAPTIIIVRHILVQRRIAKDNIIVKHASELVDLFDNEICYNAINSDSMKDYLMGILNGPEVQEREVVRFYFIETCYYLNKSMRQLDLFLLSLPKVVVSHDKVTSESIADFRFANVCQIVYDTYKDLQRIASKDTEYGFSAILKCYEAKFNSYLDFVSQANANAVSDNYLIHLEDEDLELLKRKN